MARLPLRRNPRLGACLFVFLASTGGAYTYADIS